MTDRSTGPACGNNPNFQMSDGDRKAVDDFKTRLALQAAAKPYIDNAAWVDGDPLMEVIAATVWEHCACDDADMPQLVCDDPRTIAAFAAAVARAHAAVSVSAAAPPTDRAAEATSVAASTVGANKPAASVAASARGALVELAAQAIRDSNGTPEALEWWRTHPQLIPAHVYADAVLTVLPPPADRAAVLREAADELGRMDYDTDNNDYGYDTYRDAWNGGVMDGAALLRRMADEAQQPTNATPRCGLDIETALGTYPCEREADHDGDCDERTEVDIREQAATEAPVHACPPDGSGLTPCCGRTPFELPTTDRMSADPGAVTCVAPAAVQTEEA